MSDTTRIELSARHQAHVGLAREALAKVKAREGDFAEPHYAVGFLRATVETLLRILDTAHTDQQET